MNRWVVLGAVVVTMAATAALLIRVPDRLPPMLPDDATALTVRTQPRGSGPLVGLPHDCPLGAVPPVRLVRDGQTLVFEAVEGAKRLPVVFPSGFAGWAVNGEGVLVAPEGIIVAREGDVLSRLAGSAADNGDMNVCFTSPEEYERVVDSTHP